MPNDESRPARFDVLAASRGENPWTDWADLRQEIAETVGPERVAAAEAEAELAESLPPFDPAQCACHINPPCSYCEGGQYDPDTV